MSDTITLKLFSSGRDTVKVDRDEYEQAKASGSLDRFLDPYLSDMEEERWIEEPDGTEVYPY